MTFDHIWRHVRLSQLWEATGISWVKARDSAKHPVMHGIAAYGRETQRKMSRVLSWRSPIVGDGGATRWSPDPPTEHPQTHLLIHMELWKEQEINFWEYRHWDLRVLCFNVQPTLPVVQSSSTQNWGLSLCRPSRAGFFGTAHFIPRLWNKPGIVMRIASSIRSSQRLSQPHAFLLLCVSADSGREAGTSR